MYIFFLISPLKITTSCYCLTLVIRNSKPCCVIHSSVLARGCLLPQCNDKCCSHCQSASGRAFATQRWCIWRVVSFSKGSFSPPPSSPTPGGALQRGCLTYLPTLLSLVFFLSSPTSQPLSSRKHVWNRLKALGWAFHTPCQCKTCTAFPWGTMCPFSDTRALGNETQPGSWRGVRIEFTTVEGS